MLQHTITQTNVRITHGARNEEGREFVILQFETPVWGPNGTPVMIPGTDEPMVDQAWSFPIPAEMWPQIVEMLSRTPSGIVLPEKGLILP